MKEKNKIVISIVAVALIIALVGGGTYAYWTWQSANNTVVNFTVTGGTMSIDGGGNITTKSLAPAQCTNTTYAIQRKVKVMATNETSSAMTGTIQLKVNSLTVASGHNALNATNKASIKYALVSVTEAQYEASSFTKTGDTCATGAAATGNFGSYSTGGTITLLNNLSVPANSSNNAFYYELYLWIDKSYTGTATTGTTVKDALQDLTINLEWQGSMTNQVS